MALSLAKMHPTCHFQIHYPAEMHFDSLAEVEESMADPSH